LIFKFDNYVYYLSIRPTKLGLIYCNVEYMNFIIDQYKKLVVCYLINECVYFIYSGLNCIDYPNLHVLYIYIIYM